MRVNCTFKNMDPSRELVLHAEARVEKLFKFEMKPIETVHFIFRSQARGVFAVEVVLSGPESSWQASGQGDNFYQALDLAVERVSKRMAKKKARVQHHKNVEQSREGHLSQLSEGLEPLRLKGRQAA